MKASSTASYFVPIDIPGGRDGRPINFRMSVEQINGKVTRCLRDDLQCAHYRVNRFSVGPKGWKVESKSEPTDRIDVVNDVGQPLSGIPRRHELRRAKYLPGAKA
jgi:hypothetical protein